MGDWLVDKGLEQPRAPRVKADSLDAVRKRHAMNFRASLPGGPGAKPSGDATAGGRLVTPFLSPHPLPPSFPLPCLHIKAPPPVRQPCASFHVWLPQPCHFRSCDPQLCASARMSVRVREAIAQEGLVYSRRLSWERGNGERRGKELRAEHGDAHSLAQGIRHVYVT